MSKTKVKFHNLCRDAHGAQTRVHGDYIDILSDLVSALGLVEPFKPNETQSLYIVKRMVDRKDVSIDRLAESYAVVPRPRALKIKHAEGIRNHMALARASLRNHGISLDAASTASAIVNEYLNSREVRKFSDKNFYKSREWRELRLAVLESEKKCRKCGRTPMDGIVLHVDHIKPRSIYPELSLTIGNLQVLCAECNMTKSNLIAL